MLDEGLSPAPRGCLPGASPTPRVSVSARGHRPLSPAPRYRRCGSSSRPVPPDGRCTPNRGRGSTSVFTVYTQKQLLETAPRFCRSKRGFTRLACRPDGVGHAWPAEALACGLTLNEFSFHSFLFRTVSLMQPREVCGQVSARRGPCVGEEARASEPTVPFHRRPRSAKGSETGADHCVSPSTCGRNRLSRNHKESLKTEFVIFSSISNFLCTGRCKRNDTETSFFWSGSSYSSGT